MLENQFEFMLPRSTTEAIFLNKRSMEKFKSVEDRYSRCCFFFFFPDLEKAYDLFPREIIRCVMEKKGV